MGLSGKCVKPPKESLKYDQNDQIEKQCCFKREQKRKEKKGKNFCLKHFHFKKCSFYAVIARVTLSNKVVTSRVITLTPNRFSVRNYQYFMRKDRIIIQTYTWQ